MLINDKYKIEETLDFSTYSDEFNKYNKIVNIHIEQNKIIGFMK